MGNAHQSKEKRYFHIRKMVNFAVWKGDETSLRHDEQGNFVRVIKLQNV